MVRLMAGEPGVRFSAQAHSLGNQGEGLWMVCTERPDGFGKTRQVWGWRVKGTTSYARVGDCAVAGASYAAGDVVGERLDAVGSSG